MLNRRQFTHTKNLMPTFSDHWGVLIIIISLRYFKCTIINTHCSVLSLQCLSRNRAAIWFTRVSPSSCSLRFSSLRSNGFLPTIPFTYWQASSAAGPKNLQKRRWNRIKFIFKDKLGEKQHPILKLRERDGFTLRNCINEIVFTNYKLPSHIINFVLFHHVSPQCVQLIVWIL